MTTAATQGKTGTAGADEGESEVPASATQFGQFGFNCLVPGFLSIVTVAGLSEV